MKVKRNLSIAIDVDRLLDEVGNASAYLEHLVRDADQGWRAALGELEREGWTRARILAACHESGPNGALGGPLATVVREYWRWNEALHRELAT